MRNDLIKAINEKKLVRLYYSEGYRTVEPHAYGLGNSGNDLLRGYQVDGASESDKPTGWKLFKLDEIRDLSLTENIFEERKGYRRGDSAMQKIYAEI